MEAMELKSKLLEHKVAVASVLVAVAAGLLSYLRHDSLVSQMEDHVKQEAKLEVLKYNSQNATKTLDDDLQLVARYSNLVHSRALDLDNSIALQAFFSDMVSVHTIKFDGIPSFAATPNATGIPSYFIGPYLLNGAGSVDLLMQFAKKCEEDSRNALRVDRIQLLSSDPSATDRSSVNFTVAMRAWGRRGDAAVKQPVAPQGKIVSSSTRKSKLDSLKSGMSKVVDLKNVKHLFASAASRGDSGTDTAAVGVDAAIKALKFSETMIFGQKAIKVEKYGVKRPGNSFEITVDGSAYKVTVLAVTPEGASFTISGRVVKVPFSN